jgi:hypothetical protein
MATITRTMTAIAGACLATASCGQSTGKTGGTQGTGGSSTTSSSTAGTGGSGGVMCPVVEAPITPHPSTLSACNLYTLTKLGLPWEVARIPGWKRPIAFDQVTLEASSLPLDGNCSLETNHSLLVAVGGDSPPTSADAWTKVSFNPQVPPNPLGQFDHVVVDFPRQLVPPGQNLYVALQTMGENGRLCFGICVMTSGWMWEGADSSALAPAIYQALLGGRGALELSCEGALHNNLETCPKAAFSELTAAPTEDGDLVVERLVAPADAPVTEILLEMKDSGMCVLPPEVEVIYFVGDATAPVGSDFTEAKIPKASGFRTGDDVVTFSVPVSPPLLVPAGKALYAGIRQHPDPATCIATCAGEGASEGQSWWGHTHKTPNQVVWASLASEGFTVSLRLTAIHGEK